MDFTKYSAYELKIAFAKSLKELRIYAGFSLVDLEKLTGINNPSLSRYENGRVEPSLSQAIIIADLFNLSVEDFVIYGLNEKVENTDSETIIERFNEKIANIVLEMGDNAKNLLQQVYTKINIEEIIKDYS